MGRRNRNGREQRDRHPRGRDWSTDDDQELEPPWRKRTRPERARFRDRDAGIRSWPAASISAAGAPRRDERPDPWSAEIYLAAGSAPGAAVVSTCGSCRNWLADGLPGGRGACNHPGSGFMYPYSETPACPFFDRR